MAQVYQTFIFDLKIDIPTILGSKNPVFQKKNSGNVLPLIVERVIVKASRPGGINSVGIRSFPQKQKHKHTSDIPYRSLPLSSSTPVRADTFLIRSDPAHVVGCKPYKLPGPESKVFP